MPKKPTKIIGLSLEAFNRLISAGEEIHLQSARLIPFHKPGDEIALTSIFLSTLRLVREFRINLFKAINLSRVGTIQIFTEVEFLLFENKRIDGLIIVTRGKKIIDAILIEVKNKNSELTEIQIFDYINIAKAYCIPNMLTISNQFVSFPTQSPISVKTPKSVSLYHFSWSYILTIAHILLIENNNNIEDEDQVEIMKEVVQYFESPKSGIVGFTQMKPGWADIVQKINEGVSLKLNDNSVEETVSSWLEEERDMALILSRELGLFVQAGKYKYRNDLDARVNAEKKELISNNILESIFQIDGAASNITVRPNFDRRNVEMSVILLSPQDRKTRPQITWIRNQLKYCEKKNVDLFDKIKNEIKLDINIKYASDPIRVPLDELEFAYERIHDKEIKSFSVTMIKYLGRKFVSRKGFVDAIERMLIDYYQGIVQYLKKWEKPAPQIQQKDVD